MRPSTTRPSGITGQSGPIGQHGHNRCHSGRTAPVENAGRDTQWWGEPAPVGNGGNRPDARITSSNSKELQRREVPMAIAPERTGTATNAGIGIRPPLHPSRGAPVRRLRLGTARRPAHQLPGRLGRLRAARCRVPDHVVAQRHQHRRPEVLPGHARAPPSARTASARSSTGCATPSPTGASTAATSSTTTRPTPSATSSST